MACSNGDTLTSLPRCTLCPRPSPRIPLLTWLGSPRGTARSVLLSTSPIKNSDTLRGRDGGLVSGEPWHLSLHPWFHRQPTHLLLKDTAMVSRAFSNSLLSESRLHSKWKAGSQRHRHAVGLLNSYSSFKTQFRYPLFQETLPSLAASADL